MVITTKPVTRPATTAATALTITRPALAMGTARAATAIAATIATSIPAAAAVPFARRQNSRRTNKGGDHRNRYNCSRKYNYNPLQRIQWKTETSTTSSGWMLHHAATAESGARGCYKDSRLFATDVDKNACHSQHGAMKVQGKHGRNLRHILQTATCSLQRATTSNGLCGCARCWFDFTCLVFFLQALFLVELNCDASSDYQSMQP